MALVEVLDKVAEDATTLGWIGDHRRRRRQVGDDAVLEVEDETGIGGQVEQPGPWWSGDPAQIDEIVEPVEGDLDPSRLSGAATCRGDVDGALLKGRQTTDRERLTDLVTRTPRLPPSHRELPGRRMHGAGDRWLRLVPA